MGVLLESYKVKGDHRRREDALIEAVDLAGLRVQDEEEEDAPVLALLG